MKRVKKLTRMEKIELFIGKLVLNLLAGLVLATIIIGFFWCIGTFMEWVEQSTLRLVIYFVVGGLAIGRMLLKELK